MDAVGEVKARLNIEDVVSEYVQLKRAGRNYKGLSPWTKEKTPSFIVSPEKQIWHDFSSGKGGDVFGFIMEMEGLDFKGALELLARKSGVDLDQFSSGRKGTDSRVKNRTLEALEWSAKFYQAQLKANKTALDYLVKQRGFSKETILTWRLGYSPSKGTALADFLTKKGFTTEEMKRAGLVSMRSMGARDMFRGRVMIPLCDGSGAVVGFTARLLADEPNAPKYINTPATIVYDKSRQVFGLHLAKESMRKQGFVVVTEGNLDVISSHQAGVANVVASAGTAMTEAHLKALKRFTGDIRLCFDSDQAGIAATERVIPLGQKAEVSLKIITITGAKDPDELVKKDPKTWEKSIEAAVYAPDWLTQRYSEQLNLSTAEGKRAFTDALLASVRSLSDPIEREHYLSKIAELTKTSLEAVKAKFEEPNRPQKLFKRSKVEAGAIDVIAVEWQRLQDHFLCMIMLQPKLRDLQKDLKPQYFTDETRRKLLEFLKNNPDFAGEAKVATQLQDIADYVKIITLQFEELYSGLSLEELREQAINLKRRLLDRYVKNEKEKLAAAMRQSEGEELNKLMRRANELNALIAKQ